VSAGNDDSRTAQGTAPGRPEKKMRTSPFEFLQQVRAETTKVTWPSRRETLVTTAMVFVFSIAAAVFFLVVDQVIRLVLSFVLAALR
jgi:preprotein translocase subunit SecE